jgi:hypothetical protein
MVTTIGSSTFGTDDGDPQQPRGVHRFLAEDGTRVDFEVRIASGADAQQLALVQARALRAVMTWLAAPTQSENGQARAA